MTDSSRTQCTPANISTDPYTNAADYTTGEYATERHAEMCLDVAIMNTQSFQILRQVEGRYTAPRPSQEDRSPRIDRILMPSTSMISSGWALGPIGIECKASNIKIGRPISQMLDYSRALWHHPTQPGVWIHVDWVFLWPMAPQFGPLGSVLSQQRLGSAFLDHRGRVTFTSGQHLLARSGDQRGEWEMWTDRMQHGRKAGSR